ncbi:NB-ARC domain-containing protein [Aeromonas salmonicida]
MDYISKKISEKSKLNVFTGNYRDAATQEQSRLEYVLLLILGYLWNKNILRVDDDAKCSCYQNVVRPSIGSILNLARTLDIDGEIFGDKKLKVFRDGINLYPNIRNESIGHGFSFEDNSERLYNILSGLYQTIKDSGPGFLKENIDIINVISSNENVSKGIRYKPNGEYIPCSISQSTANLENNVLYFCHEGQYYKISPFIKINEIDDFYIFSYIDDKLASRAMFNQLVKTSREYFTVDELIGGGMEIDERRVKAPNGTIINSFENNYKKYIDTAIVKKLVKFLKENTSSVFSTVWGHGGVGKTASIQRVCEVLLSEEIKYFDYITFVSAKDRKFNYHTGAIERITGNVDSYEAVIRYINSIAFSTDSSDPSEIIKFQGKMLIIIDDYETFNPGEKDSLLEFIKSLDIRHHKVVITTRSASNITGEEIEVKELSPSESLSFFDSVLENELSIDPSLYKNGKEIIELSESIHHLTSGRPLFIFQSALIYGESGSIQIMLNSQINIGKNAIEFLYGRIKEYLSFSALKIFGAMGLLTSEGDLSNLLSKLQYILNMEKDDHSFEKAVEELAKLKIITVADNKYFKVYSSEIVTLMRQSFQDDGSVTSRLQLIGRDKNLDNNLSLLNDADNSRLTKKPSEVKQKYRSIISRIATPVDIKIQAIINLAQYLIEDNGSYDEGITLLEDNQHVYNNSPMFVKTYATYLWRGDKNEKMKAINLVSNLLRLDHFTENSEKLDFLCVLMRYEATFWIDAREELKDNYRLKEITKVEYDKAFAEQRQEFYRIHNYPGLDVFNCIKNKALEGFEHDIKIKALNGLSYFIEVCLRRHQFDEIDETLTYVFNMLKYNYHDVFKRKVERINRARSNNKKHYDDYILVGSVGDRFEAARLGAKKSKATGSFGEILSAAINDAGAQS